MRPRVAAACCVVLLTVFAVLSWRAVGRMSATTDEPIHAYAAWLITQQGDYRVDREDPPLWKFVAAIPMRERSLTRTFDETSWEQGHHGVAPLMRPQMEALFESPGVDGMAFLNRSRGMMLVVGVTLGVLITAVTWVVGGPVAAVAACALFCLNPNFIGHAPLVKSDVPFTFVYFATAGAILLVGRRVSPGRVGVLAVLTAMAAVTKFSGVLVLPVVGVAMVTRALMPGAWLTVGGRALATARRRLAAAAGVVAVCALASFLIAWATYSFRFLPTRDPGVEFNMSELLGMTAAQQLRSEGAEVTPEALAAWRPDAVTGVIVAANETRLLPQAWLAGFLYTRAASWNRPAYALGELHERGVWYYFPLAMAVKTPLATSAAVVTAIVMAAVCRVRQRAWPAGVDAWTLVALGLPFAVYAATALGTRLNLGVRHVFPLFPFMFLMTGVVTAEAIRRWRGAQIIAAVLLAALAVETVVAFPEYVGYFNVACGGPRRAAYLLGDSNLDWDQDYLLLREWQDRHPDERLYCVPGTMLRPEYFGIRYTPAVPTPEEPVTGRASGTVGTLAVRVSLLQGVFGRRDDPAFELIRRAEPREIIGSSIYLYPYPLPDASPTRQ